MDCKSPLTSTFHNINVVMHCEPVKWPRIQELANVRLRPDGIRRHSDDHYDPIDFGFEVDPALKTSSFNRAPILRHTDPKNRTVFGSYSSAASITITNDPRKWSRFCGRKMVAKSAPRSQENETRQYLNCTPSVAFRDTLCGLDPEPNPACPERQSTRNHNITFVEHHTCLRPKWVPWADLATRVRLTSGRHACDIQATLTVDKKRATYKSLGVHKDRSK